VIVNQHQQQVVMHVIYVVKRVISHVIVVLDHQHLQQHMRMVVVAHVTHVVNQVTSPVIVHPPFVVCTNITRDTPSISYAIIYYH
jgi:hypothetical protein